MNKRSLVLLGVAIMLWVLITPVSMEAQAVSPWETRELSPSESSVFSFEFSLVKNPTYPCSIWIRRDGTGITVAARDNSYVDKDYVMGKLSQTLTITKTKRTVSYGKTRGMNLPAETQNGYDIFGEHCAISAKQLPGWVRDLFYGAYGLGKRP